MVGRREAAVVGDAFDLRRRDGRWELPAEEEEEEEAAEDEEAIEDDGADLSVERTKKKEPPPASVMIARMRGSKAKG